MTVLIGANPIGWTNDDLQEIGGDTTLETCLAEAKEARVKLAPQLSALGAQPARTAQLDLFGLRHNSVPPLRVAMQP